PSPPPRPALDPAVDTGESVEHDAASSATVQTAARADGRDTRSPLSRLAAQCGGAHTRRGKPGRCLARPVRKERSNDGRALMATRYGRRARRLWGYLRSERRTLRQGFVALLVSTGAALVAGVTL